MLTEQTRSEMRRTVNDLTDAALEKELAFAEGFALEDDAGKAWHEALQEEKTRRTA